VEPEIIRCELVGNIDIGLPSGCHVPHLHHVLIRGSARGPPFRPFKETETGLHGHGLVSPQTDETQRMVPTQ
jgi:hypothetical protein